MTHFVGVEELTEQRFAGARRFAAYLGAMVAAATAHPAGHVIATPLACHRRPGHKPCPGRLVVHRSEAPPQIDWACQSCGEEGMILNWEGCPWDLSPSLSATTEREAIALSQGQYALLRSIVALDLDAQRLVAAGVLGPGDRVLLELADDELENLIEAVAAEANHERGRRRHGLDELAGFLEDSTEAGDSAMTPHEDHQAFGPRPLGREYLHTTQSSERNVGSVTVAGLEQSAFGVRAPLIESALSEALERLTELASCHWGCRGKSHTIENLLRRFVNLALAAHSLAWAGYYDEALLLVRSGGEVANLLQLFALQPDKEHAWFAQPESKDFVPVKVRLAIETAGQVPFIDQHRYAALSKVSAHATHKFALASHDLSDRRVTRIGPWFEINGFCLVIGEILAIVQPVLIVAGGLTSQAPDRQLALAAVAEVLEGLRPPVTILNYEAVLTVIQTQSFGLPPRLKT